MNQNPIANPFLLLAIVFAPLSTVTIGGGQSAIAEIHKAGGGHPSLDDYGAVRRRLCHLPHNPGPGSMLATPIGWQVAGFWRAVVATLGLFAPTAFLIYGVVHLWSRYKGARWQTALEAGLRPVAAGMIVAEVYVLLRSLDGGWVARSISLVSAAVLMMSRINTIIIIGLGTITFAGIGTLSMM